MAPRALILDLLAWIAAAPRSYGEVMEAWRTSCPRLTVWEDALDQGLVCRRRNAGEEPSVELTEAGRATLEAHAALSDQPEFPAASASRSVPTDAH